MTSPNTVELPPQASRTIEGLRDTGYEPHTALADIVDNSIAASATRVEIRLFADLDAQLVVTVADNGSGMTPDELQNAMTYGSAIRQDPFGLGKFGLGLKTASTALCRELTVTSRKSAAAPPAAARWDLDFVVEKNKWLLQLPEVDDFATQLLDEISPGGSGTVVVLRKVDRLLDRDFKSAKKRQNALNRVLEALMTHFARTYQRYLDDRFGHEPVRISLNGEEVQPWDPFGLNDGSELILEQEVDAVVEGPEGDSASAPFSVKAYALPPRSEMTEEQEQRLDPTTKNQGFYVYRHDRLIASGNWLGLRSTEPHLNLNRIDLSFDHRLDEAFQLDIKKSRIRMRPELQDFLRTLVTPALREGESRYRKNERTSAVATSGTRHGTSNRVIGGKEQELGGGVAVEPAGPGKAKVRNAYGETQISLPVLEEEQDLFIAPVDSIDDGLLWEPALVNGKKGLRLNVGHEFYQRVYQAAQQNPIAVQGIDFLLWALSLAELQTVRDDEHEFMRNVRAEVSRHIRRLARELPEVT